MASKIAYPEMSPWDSLCEEIREQGREQAREQTRASIRRIVRERFGRRPRWLASLRSISDDEALGEIVVKAATIDDLDDLRAEIERVAPPPSSAPARRSTPRRGRTPKRR